MEFTLDYFAGIAEDAIKGIHYPEVAPGLYEPVRYAMESGGKRLRPALCLAVYSALTHCTPEKAISQALAIEMFHNFTLLHDDVMDNADVRRGRPSVHKRWGENAAILSGDTMLTMAYTLLSKEAGPCFSALFDIFNRTAMEVYQGQQLDMDFESCSYVKPDEYIEMIRLKTSVLLGCACQVGAMMAGAADDICLKFYDYGIALGLAFQLRDDWLDTFGDPVIFGKEIGGDILNNKKTWLLIKALEEGGEELSQILSDELCGSEKIERVTSIYSKYKLGERCMELAHRYSADAVDSIKGIELDINARNFFSQLAYNAAQRNH